MDWPVDPISDQDSLAEMERVILYGNHKSARKNGSALYKSLNKKVVHGWQLPLLLNRIHLIPGAIIAPLGYVLQFTINKKGERILKGRTTHDQSACFNPNPDTHLSVNQRVRHDELSPIKIGHTASQHIHWICCLWQKFPHRNIRQAKYDIKSAF